MAPSSLQTKHFTIAMLSTQCKNRARMATSTSVYILVSSLQMKRRRFVSMAEVRHTYFSKRLNT